MPHDHEIEETREFRPAFAAAAGGLLPVIVQEGRLGRVLMLAWANIAAVETTIRTGRASFFSRSRNKAWTKGEGSGNVLIVKEILVDCDQDCLLYIVKAPAAPACHTTYPQSDQHRAACFYRSLSLENRPVSETQQSTRSFSELPEMDFL